ncbi:MAG: antibiotic biosynthesis monooxygenase [Sphingobacteriales bacterium]|nr:MAG: antibiotic biosynthesis monooxygenase [Sphingobacteriales bacterium]
MTIEYIRYKVDADQRSKFVDAYKNAAHQLDESIYCKGYELSECEEEEGQFMLRIEWTSSEEHIKGFRESEQFGHFLSHVKPFFNNIQEMRHYQVTDVNKRK